jgi:putative hydrolase of the HAD superfamily
MKQKNINVSKIKGVILDLDNTIYFYEPAHKLALIASHRKYPVKCSFKVFVKKYNVARNANELALHGTGSSHNRLLYFQRMLESDKCFAPNHALDLYRIYWTKFITSAKLEPDLRNILLTLVRKYKIGIITDLTADIQFAKISAYRLWPFIDAIVTSEEVGIEKPDTRGMKLLLKKMNLRANEVIVVGDNPATDGLCASRMKIPYIQLVKPDMNLMPKGVRVWKKIKRLKEIHKILAAL